MTKPAITKRATKGSALTYSELDTNFQNLADATITVSDGTNSKALNLNDTLEFTAGSNITIGVNSSTGVVTITGTGSGTINSGASGALAFYPSAGTTIDDTRLIYTDMGSGDVRLALDGSSGGVLALGNSNTGINLYPGGGGGVAIINSGLGTEGTIGVNLSTASSVLSGGYTVYNGGASFIGQAGLAIIQNLTTRNVALWICGGGSAVKISDSLSDTSGTMAYFNNAGTTGYNWTGTSTGHTIMWLQTSALS
jgi:hypothetical protein